MPSDKRARQRAQRELKVAKQQRTDHRRRRTRQVIGALIAAGIIIGIIFAITSGSGKSPTKAAATSTTAKGSSTTTTSALGTTSTPGAHTSSTTAKTTATPKCPPAGGSTTRVTSFKSAPPDCISHTGVFDATVKTDVGTFVLEMRAASSYAAVNNFVFLARYHYFNGIIFHRVIPGFVVQGGDPTGTGTGGPGYTWTGNTPKSSCSSSSSGICYPLGSLAMANTTGPSTNGSQFFIVVGSSGETLQPNYTLFGKVITGMSVVNKIAADGSSSGTPKVTHHMITVTIRQRPA